MWLQGVTLGGLIWALALLISLLIYLYGEGVLVIVRNGRRFGAGSTKIMEALEPEKK